MITSVLTDLNPIPQARKDQIYSSDFWRHTAYLYAWQTDTTFVTLTVQ